MHTMRSIEGIGIISSATTTTPHQIFAKNLFGSCATQISMLLCTLQKTLHLADWISMKKEIASSASTLFQLLLLWSFQVNTHFYFHGFCSFLSNVCWENFIVSSISDSGSELNLMSGHLWSHKLVSCRCKPKLLSFMLRSYNLGLWC